MNNRIVGSWARIGLTAVSTLLAVQLTTAKASASAQEVTVTSVSRTSLTTIEISGTATFSQGDVNALVGGTLAQGLKSTVWVASANQFFNDVPVSTNAGDPHTFTWTMTFSNPNGWKKGPATLSIFAYSRDSGQDTQVTRAGKLLIR